jgi:hypothetical protein
MGYIVLENRNRIEEAAKTTTALCAIRAQLDHDIERTTDFLRENPDGNGFSPAVVVVIRRGLADDRATRQSLDVLECPPN